MTKLLVDTNLDGHGDLLDMRLRTATWNDFREYLELQFLHFEDIELGRSSKDQLVWRLCQERGLFLLTANRNEDSKHALEATIRRESTPQSLPVFTFADAPRIYRSVTYLDKVIEKLLDYLMNQERYLGAGRLFLP